MPTVKFENIPYARPDYKQYARNIELCAQAIRNADTMETLRRELEEFWGYRTHVETMETLGREQTLIAQLERSAAAMEG